MTNRKANRKEWDEFRRAVEKLKVLNAEFRQAFGQDMPSPLNLSKYEFPAGTLVQVRMRRDIDMYDRVYNVHSYRRDAFPHRYRVPGAGFWTVIGSHRIEFAGWWHEIVRGDGVKGWVDDLQRDFVVCKEEGTGV